MVKHCAIKVTYYWFIFTEELPHSIWKGFSSLPPPRQNSVGTSTLLHRAFLNHFCIVQIDDSLKKMDRYAAMTFDVSVKPSGE